MNLDQLRRAVCEIAKTVGEFQRNELASFDRERIVSKGFNDPVSYVDKSSEEMLVRGLKQLLPNAGFLAEEGTVETQTEGLHWVIDPLDGTNNFVHRVPFFGVCVALADGTEPLLGVVHEPNRNECFSASKGGNAFINEERISVSACTGLKDSLVATGFPYDLGGREEQHFAIIKHVLHHSHGIRRFGSAALDLCYVACGRFDAYYEFNLKPWDILAGAIIAREAGAQVTDFAGNSDIYNGNQLLATSGFQQEFIEVIAKHWNPS